MPQPLIKRPEKYPYTIAELFHMAQENKKFDPMRILATYADPENWESAYNGPNGSKQWVWKGPVICAFELAQWGIK